MRVEFSALLQRKPNELIVPCLSNFTIEYEKNNEFFPFHFNSIEKFDKQGTINSLGFLCNSALNSTRTLHFQKYIDVNAELLKVLREEYHLE